MDWMEIGNTVITMLIGVGIWSGIKWVYNDTCGHISRERDIEESHKFAKIQNYVDERMGAFSKNVVARLEDPNYYPVGSQRAIKDLGERLNGRVDEWQSGERHRIDSRVGVRVKEFADTANKQYQWVVDRVNELRAKPVDVAAMQVSLLKFEMIVGGLLARVSAIEDAGIGLQHTDGENEQES